MNTKHDSLTFGKVTSVDWRMPWTDPIRGTTLSAEPERGVGIGIEFDTPDPKVKPWVGVHLPDDLSPSSVAAVLRLLAEKIEAEEFYTGPLSRSDREFRLTKTTEETEEGRRQIRSTAMPKCATYL